MPAQSVPLLSRRREAAALIQKVQHVVPAIPLLAHGLARLGHERHGWSFALGAAEVVVSAVVVVAFLRQVVATRRGHAGAANEGHAGRGHGHGVDWVDLFLGAMLGVEVWAHWHESGHIKRPTVLLAVAMVAIGLLHGRIAAMGMRRNALRVDDDGVDVGGKPFRRFRAAWDQLAAVELDAQRARLVRRDGRTREIDLRDMRNAADVRAALESARLRLSARADDEAPAAPASAERRPEA